MACGSTPTRGPLLLVAGGADHTAPPAITKPTLKLYRKSTAVTEYKEFPGRGHSLALDTGWRDLADTAPTLRRPGSRSGRSRDGLLWTHAEDVNTALLDFLNE